MRPLQEILENGSDDELADWIEAYEPSPDNWEPVEEYFLRCAGEYVGTDDAEAADYVAAALSRGVSWSRVAEALGLSVDEARNRFPGAESAALKASEEFVASLALVVSAAATELEASVALEELAELAAADAPAAPLASAALAELAKSPGSAASAAPAPEVTSAAGLAGEA